MYITSDKHTELTQKLFDKWMEMRDAGVTHIKQYEIAFQNVIEEVFPDKLWWEVTKCQIFMHLMEHRDPEKTVIEILKELIEED